MAHMHWHPHVSVPILHFHAPHLEWHELAHPARAALVTTATLLTFAVLVVGAQDLRGLVDRSPTPAAQATDVRISKELPREWRWQPRSVSFDHMYRAQPRSGIESMYGSPQARAARAQARSN